MEKHFSKLEKKEFVCQGAPKIYTLIFLQLDRGNVKWSIRATCTCILMNGLEHRRKHKISYNKL